MKDKEKQIEEMCNEIINIQKQARTEYCIRLQKAFEYKGNSDYEDIPSILKDYEDLIMNRYYKDSVVLSREEYELLTNDLDKHDYGEFESGYSQGSKETAEKIIAFIEEKDRIAGKYSIYSKLLAELKEQYEVKKN